MEQRDTPGRVPAVPRFADVQTPADVRIPRWLAVAAGVAAAAGFLWGARGEGEAGVRALRAVSHAAGLLYLGVSLVDFWEHFRLEKAASGRYVGWEAVPFGESVNHAATIAVLLSFLLLARPFPDQLDARDWWVIVAPGVFLALGWRDEIVYHRRRATHREDILHTTAHLAAAVLLTTFAMGRLTRW